MTAGITRQALRRHRWSLVGPAATQAIGACVIAVMLTATHSINVSLGSNGTLPDGATEVVEELGIFLGNAAYLSVLIVGVTMSLTASRQLRDLALLRSIGATPGQVRRCLVRQAVIVSVPASVVGLALAVPICAVWLAAMRWAGAVPAAVGFHLTPWALVVAIAVELGASLLGTTVAAVRPSRVPPAGAMTESVAGRGPIGSLRVRIGAALVVGGVVLSAALALTPAAVAENAGILVVLGQAVGVGLLGPLILRTVVGMLRPVAGNGLGRLALDDLAAASRSFSGALVPLVLAVAFVVIQDAMLTTAQHATGVVSTPERLMVFSGTASMALFAAVASMNCLLTVAVGQRRDVATLQLVGGSRRDVLVIRWVQVGVFAGTGLAIAGGISLATLVPLALSAYGMPLPYVSPLTIVLTVLAVGGLAAVGLVLPAAVQMKIAPITVLRADV